MVDSENPGAMSPQPFPWRIAIGCLVLLSAMIAYLVHLGHQNSIAERERSQQRRESESFRKIKSGGTQVAVFQSPKVLFMLADDPECVHNLTSIYFFMADLSDSGFSVTTQLSNVSDIGVYDCERVNTYFHAIRGMPSLNSVYIEAVKIDDKLLTGFSSFPNLKSVRFEQILDDHQIELLSSSLPNALIEVGDPNSDKPRQIVGGTP